MKRIKALGQFGVNSAQSFKLAGMGECPAHTLPADAEFVGNWVAAYLIFHKVIVALLL